MFPYKGAGPVLKDLLGGQIDLAFDPAPALPQARVGKLRLLAVAALASPRRLPRCADLRGGRFPVAWTAGRISPSTRRSGTPPLASSIELNREVVKLMQEPLDPRALPRARGRPRRADDAGAVRRLRPRRVRSATAS